MPCQTQMEQQCSPGWKIAHDSRLDQSPSTQQYVQGPAAIFFTLTVAVLHASTVVAFKAGFAGKSARITGVC